MKKVDIVIGSNYGDEGKGTVVANLTKGYANILNILTNGGSQRGHSIFTCDGSFTFQHFGSGTYHGADNYYSAWYILNPIQFVKEYEQLVRKPKHIYRDRRCRWSTPYDVMANLITEEQKGRLASCGMGIWMTVQRCNHTPIKLFNEFIILPLEEQTEYLNTVKAYYEKFLTVPDKWKDMWNSENIQKHFLSDCCIMHNLTEEIELGSLDYDNLIFENGQGLLLSDIGKDTSDTTPSNTGIHYALSMANEIGISDITAHYVTRPYLTRHGDGEMENQSSRDELSKDVLEDRTNHFNEHQGEFRYGKLDINSLKNRILEDVGNVKYQLDITHCDEMDRVSEFKKYFDTINIYDSPLV